MHLILLRPSHQNLIDLLLRRKGINQIILVGLICIFISTGLLSMHYIGYLCVNLLTLDELHMPNHQTVFDSDVNTNQAQLVQQSFFVSTLRNSEPIKQLDSLQLQRKLLIDARRPTNEIDAQIKSLSTRKIKDAFAPVVSNAGILYEDQLPVNRQDVEAQIKANTTTYVLFKAGIKPNDTVYDVYAALGENMRFK